MQNTKDLYDVLIVGAGLSGCVTAERFANVYNKKVLIVDSRDHIAGNCYDYIDQNGILINKYGAHLFHTNDQRVWDYVQKYGQWQRWQHKVVGLVDSQLVSIPVNITTVNMLCGTNIQTEQQMQVWLNENAVKFETINNGEQVAKSRVGEVLYEKIFKNYTWKQWNKYPAELSAQVLARIPIRKNFDSRYFTDKYQALPVKGYTKICESMINHPNIQVKTSFDYFQHKDSPQFQATLSKDCILIYTGPVDRYFKNSQLPPLQYRSIQFKVQHIKNINGYYQPNSVVNYPQPEPQFTRIVQYKHFLNQKSPHTTIVRQVTTDKGQPYYPVPNKKNQEIYEQYKQLAISQTRNKNVHFLGRLANYKYFNMDQAIANALDYFQTIQVKKSQQ